MRVGSVINNYKKLQQPSGKVTPAPNAKDVKNDQKSPPGGGMPYSPKEKSHPTTGREQKNINRGRLVGEEAPQIDIEDEDESKAPVANNDGGSPKKPFDLCKKLSAQEFKRLQSEGKDPTLLQVAGYRGHPEFADQRWQKLHKDYWIHYVVVAEGTVYDPTIKQFNPNGTSTYTLAELKNTWKSIYTIMGPEITQKSE